MRIMRVKERSHKYYRTIFVMHATFKRINKKSCTKFFKRPVLTDLHKIFTRRKMYLYEKSN